MALQANVSDVLNTTFSPALLTLLLGFRDQKASFDKAADVEQAIAQNLQEAYDSHSVPQLREALTTAIEQLERQHARALERVQRARSQNGQPRAPSLLRNLTAWLSSSEGEAQHYKEAADKLNLQLKKLLSIRDALVSSQDSPASYSRRLLQDGSQPTLIDQQQYSCFPSGRCQFSQLTNGRAGFQAIGDSGSNSGFSVSAAGDINGDGLGDFVVGADGKVFVLFGSANRTAWGNGTLDLNSFADGQRGFVLHSEIESSTISAPAGDINGDGIADLMVVTPTDEGPDRVYVLFGSNASNAWGTGNLNLNASSLMNGQRGFTLQSATSVMAISTAGDVNGDGLSDLQIGEIGDGSAGETYIVFGSRNNTTWGTGHLNLNNLANGVRGFVLLGTGYERSGYAVSSADINGDKIADLIIGAYVGDATYVVFGSKNSTAWGNGTLSLRSFVDGQKGFVLTGDGCGWSLSAGDVNGDGFDDIVVGCYRGDTFVVFGSDFSGAWDAGTVDLSLINGFQGIKLADPAQTSSVVVSAGDVNGDRLVDIMVGVPGAGVSEPSVYVVFGSNSWDTSALDLRSCMNSRQGFAIYRSFDDSSLMSASTVGDIDGDGLVELLIGSPFADSSAGKAYLMLSHMYEAYFTANELRLAASQTVTLTPQNLNIAQSGDVNLTRILIDRVEQGYFSYISSPNGVLAHFTVQDVIERVVQFVHTGNTAAPNYRLCFVVSGLLRKLCSEAQVDFLGHLPNLVNNQLTVNQGLSTTLKASDLSASDQDNTPSQLTFIISDLRHGNFSVFDDTTNMTNVSNVFTAQAVLKGYVRFVPDKSRDKPSYSVAISDTKSLTEPQSAAITFTFEPQLTLASAKLVLDQGQGTTLSPQDFNASDVETFEGSIIFQVANVTSGHFAYSSNLNFSITSFQQLSLITGGVQFVHDGSAVAPSFAVCAYDGELRSPWQSPRIYFNHRPVRQGNAHDVKVEQGIKFHFTMGDVGFSDPDNDTLTYRALLKGGAPLPAEISFTPPDQFSGKIPSVGSFNIQVEVHDVRGLVVATDFMLSCVVPSFDIEKLYTSLSSILGIGVTVMAYLWLRRRIAKHRRNFPFVNHLRKALNLEYYDFTRFDGDAYRTKANEMIQKLQVEHPDFYTQLTPQEKKSFAVCVAEILTKRGLVSRSGYGGGLFGVFCMLNVGWPNELDLEMFEVQGKSIIAEAVQSWKEAVLADKDYEKPLARWPYLSPSRHEKLDVFFCCAKPSSANRWRPTKTSDVALTELKTHEGPTLVK